MDYNYTENFIFSVSKKRAQYRFSDIRKTANWVNKSIELIPENARENYRESFIHELKKDVFEPLTPEKYDFTKPRHFAVALKDEMKKHFGLETEKAIELLVKKL